MDCPHCGVKTKIYGISKKGSTKEPKGCVDYYRCNDCQLVFQEIAPDLGKEEFYKYYQGGLSWEDYKMRRLEELGSAWQANRFYLSFLKKYAPEAKSIFDLGCGVGQFLFVAKRAGYEQLAGIEYSEKAARFAQEIFEIPVFVGDFCETTFDRKYDVVTIIQTIEHLNNPKEVLSKVREVTNPNGKLMIATPDVDSFVSKLWKMKWQHINMHHIYLYNSRSLTKLLHDAGFRVLKVQRQAMYCDNWFKSYLNYGIVFLTALLKGKTLPKVSNADGIVVIAEKI